MMYSITLDFETRSRVDLKACGTDVYASDPSTDILCLAVIDNNGMEWLWFPHKRKTPPSGLVNALKRAEEYRAFNARFDKLIYEYIAVSDYDFPELDSDKWWCLAAQCRLNALPGSLDDATRASNAKHRKDHAGAALIRKLCIPNAAGEFNTDPVELDKLGQYCLQDVRATIALMSTTRPATDEEKQHWRINERINDAGVTIDRELAELAARYAAQEKAELGARLSKLTGGAITKVTQTQRVLKAFREEVKNPELLRCITKAGKNLKGGEVKYTLDKNARGLLLDSELLTGYWREVIELIDQGSNSSVSKFAAMLRRRDPETDRVHGAFIFAGAGQTHRYSSKGLQLHNMRRDCWKVDEAENLIDDMAAGKDLPAPVMDTLARLLRPAVVPAEGCKLIVGDWSSIEARALPWLTLDPLAEAMLDVFRRGDDVYVSTAQGMGIDDRQIGKVATLSLGYGGAVGAFMAMAANYGVDLPENQVLRIVDLWRRANPWAVRFWAALERAAVKALRNPGTAFNAGRLRYVFVPGILGGTLMCILPNNAVIQYPYARLENGSVTAMKASVKPRADSTDEWPRMTLWGGFMAENATQGLCAYLLQELLQDMVLDGLPVIAHCHDEVILEVPALKMEIENALAEVKEYMEYVPEWAEGLPLAAEPVSMWRYGK